MGGVCMCQSGACAKDGKCVSAPSLAAKGPTSDANQTSFSLAASGQRHTARTVAISPEPVLNAQTFWVVQVAIPVSMCLMVFIGVVAVRWRVQSRMPTSESQSESLLACTSEYEALQ